MRLRLSPGYRIATCISRSQPEAECRPQIGGYPVGRPRRSQRRQQRLAAAAAEQLALRDRLLGHLVMQHQAAYKRTALDLARPAADFVGFRAGRQVARSAAARRHPMTSWSGLPSPA